MNVIDARTVGRAAQLAGVGRQRVGDSIDPAAGVRLHCALGDSVAEGDTLAEVFARDSRRRAAASAVLEQAFGVADEPPAAMPVVLGRD